MKNLTFSELRLEVERLTDYEECLQIAVSQGDDSAVELWSEIISDITEQALKLNLIAGA